KGIRGDSHMDIAQYKQRQDEIADPGGQEPDETIAGDFGSRRHLVVVSEGRLNLMMDSAACAIVAIGLAQLPVGILEIIDLALHSA
ncbi:hypothetical protein RSW36_26725, partial [Escherichia coli]|uniref:hypothetical protein n=1 Tax=Escherichia coli TaxID=562 RepID=UPI0028DFFB85